MSGMTKLIYNDSFTNPNANFNVSLVEDTSTLTKQASVFAKIAKDIQPDKDHVGIHVIALGESERYGFNRNGDGFPKKACVDYHPTFVKYGHVYEHHQNKDPEKKLGDIIKSAYNEDMGRIELFIHAHRDKAASHLEKLASTGEVPVSMACRVKEDRCSVCDQLRSSSKDPRQCSHIAMSLGKTAEDGQVVGTYNDHPKFFDISFVYRPADRIAWNLNKAASAAGVDGIKLAEDAGLWTPPELILEDGAPVDKLDILKKMASFENMYRNIAQRGPQDSWETQLWELRKSACNTSIDDAYIADLRRYEPEDVLPTLARNKVILDPESYCKYAMGIDLGQLRDHLDEVKQACDGVFTRLLKEGKAYDVCSDSSYDFITPSKYVIPQASTLDSKVAMVKNASSFSDEFAYKRAIDITASGSNPRISGNSVPSNTISQIAKVVSEKYASYKLASVNAMRYFHPSENTDRQLAILAVQSMFK
jgi:hypothetical protein